MMIPQNLLGTIGAMSLFNEAITLKTWKLEGVSHEGVSRIKGNVQVLTLTPFHHSFTASFFFFH